MVNLQNIEYFDNLFINNLEDFKKSEDSFSQIEKESEIMSSSNTEIISNVEEKLPAILLISENEIKFDQKKLIKLKKIFYRNYRYKKSKIEIKNFKRLKKFENKQLNILKKIKQLENNMYEFRRLIRNKNLQPKN